MTIEFVPAEKWGGQLFVKTPEKSGEEALFQTAANHLVEHCLIGGFNKAETRNGYVRYDLPSMREEKGTLGVLKSLMKTSYALRHPTLENLPAEKEAIIEEWGRCAAQPDKFKFFGGFVNPVMPEKWDSVDETMTPEKGMAFLNRQADYTKSFTAEELQHHMLATYGAKQMTMRISGPSTVEEIQDLVRRGGLQTVPTEHPNGREITYRPVPATHRYQDMSRTDMQIDMNASKVSRDDVNAVIRRVGKALHNNPQIGLYTYDNNDGVMSFSFAAGKENLINA